MPRDYKSSRSLTVTKGDAKVIAAMHAAKKRDSAVARARSAPGATRGFAPGYGMKGLKGEKKVIDTSYTSHDCNTTGSVTALNLCATGTDYTNRVGRLAKMESVQLRGMVQPEDADINNSLARVLLIWDSQPNGGALPAVTDILNAANSTSFNNLTNRDRFKVLRDHFVSHGFSQSTATQTFSNNAGQPGWIINDYVQLGEGYVTQWGGTGATIGDIQHGSLLLVTIGNQAAGAGSVLVCSTRVRFTDA